MPPIAESLKDAQSAMPPENLVSRVWQELTRATKDRHHAWRRPSLATIGLDGSPQVRTIVLRHVNQSQLTLEAYTDSRSSKCQEILKSNRAQLVFWSDRLKWQLRVSVYATIEEQGEVVERAWHSIRQASSAKDYLAMQAPGSVLTPLSKEQALIFKSPSDHHLAVLRFNVMGMDWLALGKDLHRRAYINSDGLVTALWP